MEENKVVVGLIRGRHEMPVDKYIFDEIEDVFDFEKLNKTVSEFIGAEVGIGVSIGQCINQWDYIDIEHLEGQKDLVVYVTGLTAATAALISVCAKNGVKLTLMHYDMKSGEYREQVIF